MAILAAVAALVLVMPAGAARAGEPLDVAVRVGPWPSISRLIAYDGRIWLANSVRGRNDNAADIWSVDPESLEVRYERHLFSQDVGAPVVQGGLLYWAHEDSRASLGWGAASVTDATAWRDLVIPTAQIFHVHGLASWRGGLLAVSSAWRAGFQFSRDGGTTWEPLYDHATPEGRVSRMPRFALLGGRVYATMRDAGTNRLVSWDGSALADVPEWPVDADSWSLTMHRGALYWIARDTDTGHAVWTLRHGAAQRLEPPAADWRPVSLTETADVLWALTRTDDAGRLWRSADGVAWQEDVSVSGGKPDALHAVADGLYVSGTGEDGTGALWVVRQAHVAANNDVPPLPTRDTEPLSGAERNALVADIEAALADPESFTNHGRNVLRAPVYRLARAGRPGGEALAGLLEAAMAPGEAAMLGGQFTVPQRDLGQWILLWGMGQSGAGRVPVSILERPWNVEPHSSEKYFHPLPMALWAISQTGQKDAETLDALVARLDKADDPLWLKGDVVGALTAVTGERFGYDAAAWQAWLKAR